MTPPLGNVGRGSHVNTLLVVLLVSLADVHLRMRCFAELTTRIPTTNALTTISTTALTNNSYEQLSPTSAANNNLETPPDDGSYRLPTFVRPFHYFVHLHPFLNYVDPAEFRFRGHVSISIRCYNATNKIILHKEILSVDNSSVELRSVTDSPSGNPNVTSIEEDPARHFLILRLDKNLEVGLVYVINIRFTSPLKNDPYGLYYSNSSRGNTTVYTVASFLEPVYARRVFPCFDEPAMRATFTVSIVRPADRISLSNMPLDFSNVTSIDSGYSRDVYQITPKMSTYMLAFVVCDFLHLSKKTKSNVTYNTWAKPSDVNKTRYVLDVAVKIHDFFEDYFDVKFPLPKQDIVAISNFPLGAMENWGLILCRDMFLLYEERVTNEWHWRLVPRVVAHEIAHMWLGNLVTQEWWNEFWLKEAFVSYFDFLATENVTDSWKMFEHFIVDRQQSGFHYDQAADSRPLYFEVLTSADLDNLVSYLPFVKGPSVARMLNFILGESTFQKAFRNFIKGRLYGTYVQGDLYNEMTQQAKADGLDFNVADFMDTWVLQGNFPVVTVTQDFRKDGYLHVSQERFLQDSTDKYTGEYISPFNFRWNIPLTFASSQHIVFNQTGEDVYWLKRDEPAKTISVNFPLPKCTSRDGWILANVHGYGFYRVNYQIGNWLALSQQLKTNHEVIPISNRAQIINDAFSLYKANYIPLDTALTTLEYLHQEREYPPWDVAQTELASIGHKLVLTPLYKPFETFMRRKLTPAFNDFSLRNISYNINLRKLHSILASRACQFKVQLCLDQAVEIYRTVMSQDGQSYLHPDVKKSIYCYGVAAGNLFEWELALKLYNETADSEVKSAMIDAMVCATKPHILNRYVALLLDGSTFSKEYALQVLTKVIGRPEGRATAWDFYVENYNALRDKYNKTFECSAVLPRLTTYFNTQEELGKVTAFWGSQCEGYKQADFETRVKNHIKKNIEWLDKHSPIIKAWLNKNNIQT
ncbi:hypothetical protein BsWGS_03970 [Bradybaena similaris]